VRASAKLTKAMAMAARHLNAAACWTHAKASATRPGYHFASISTLVAALAKKASDEGSSATLRSSSARMRFACSAGRSSRTKARREAAQCGRLGVALQVVPAAVR
jgi:hypothetical protein